MAEEKLLLSVNEFAQYLGIGKTKAREIIQNPTCKFVVRVGRRVFVHKELLNEELKKERKVSISNVILCEMLYEIILKIEHVIDTMMPKRSFAEHI